MDRKIQRFETEISKLRDETANKFDELANKIENLDKDISNLKKKILEESQTSIKAIVQAMIDANTRELKTEFANMIKKSNKQVDATHAFANMNLHDDATAVGAERVVIAESESAME